MNSVRESVRLPTRAELSLVATFLLAICAIYLTVHEVTYGGPVYTSAEMRIIGASGALAAGCTGVIVLEAASRLLNTESSTGKGR